MVKFIKKRTGAVVPFNKQKIINAISKAGDVRDSTKEKIATYIENYDSETLSVEEIQDLLETELMKCSKKNVAREFVRYRYKRELIREQEKTSDSILRLIDNKNDYLRDENSNKNSSVASTQRDYMAGEVSKDLSRRLLLPEDVIEAHDLGVIHFHDMDYFAQHMFNCCLVNLEDMLQNGTVINSTMIEKPHSFSTACNVATQISACIASGQYGGQTMSLTHLAPFVQVSRERFTREVIEELKEANVECSEEAIKTIVESRVRGEIKKGVKIVHYQLNTLNSSNGQTPFITLFMYLNEAKNEQEKKDLALIIEEVLKQRIQGTKNEVGAWISPAFPKLIYVLEEDNVTENTPFWYLTELAAKCTAKRLVPDYISEKKMIELKGYCFPCMGCRSFLSPWFDHDGKPKFYGRMNQGVVTINLPFVALEAARDVIPGDGLLSERFTVTKKSMKKFWEHLDSRLELCHKALQCRHRRLLNTSTGISPIHWQNGALSRLGKDDNINSLLFGSYSTISLGYAGLYECVRALTGEPHTSPKGKKLALEILQIMNDKCNQWKAEENIGYSVYGTPLESTTYKFAGSLKKEFGEIKEISDHDYITNSYHVNVREEIDPFQKLKLEAEYQALSQGGCISYVETANLQENIQAVLEVMKFIYDNIMYAELNTKSDYCQVCGSTREIEIVENEKGNLIWRCPNCGNTDQRKMNVARRTCGYIGSNFWNAGRTQEIRDRYVHLGSESELNIE